MQRTPQRAPTRIDLGPRLPHVVARVLERVLRDDGTVTEEWTSVRPTQALIKDLEKVSEDVWRLEVQERFQRWTYEPRFER